MGRQCGCNLLMHSEHAGREGRAFEISFLCLYV